MHKRTISAILITLILMMGLYPSPQTTQAQDALDPPALRQPADQSMTYQLRPSLRWNSVRGADLFRIDLADNPAFTNPILLDYETRSTTLALNTRVLPAELRQGTHYWRVQVRNRETGAWSVESAVFSFTVHFQRAPRDDSFSRVLRPAFTWVRSRDALRYRFVLDDNAGFTSPLEIITTDNRQTRYQPPRGADMPFANYYWRVDAEYADGWHVSPVVFQMIVTPRPLPPVRVSDPANNSWTNDSTPTLTWEPTTDPDGQPVSYEVQVSTVSNFRTFLAETVTLDTSYTVPPTTVEDGSLYWRVRALNYLGVPGSWSTRRTIRLDRVAPAAPLLQSPADGTTNYSGIFEYRWRSVRDAESYEIQIGSGAVINTGRQVRYTPEQPVALGQHSWRVRAIDRAGNHSEWSVNWFVNRVETEEEIVLRLVNEERCSLGLVPLALNNQLNAAALVHSRDMANRNFFDHTGSDGRNAGQRITRAGYPWTMWAENIAAGYTTPEAVHTAWMNSPGHRSNILNPNVREMGLAKAYNSRSYYGTYWTQVFGNRAGAPQLTCAEVGISGASVAAQASPQADFSSGIIGLPASSTDTE